MRVKISDGRSTKVRRIIRSVKSINKHARFFDDGSQFWTHDKERNFAFLKMQQYYCNERLRTQGYLLLNDVYEMLGLEQSFVGECIGWIYDKGKYIDFGLKWCHPEDVTHLLEFNVVDEDIRHKIEEL